MGSLKVFVHWLLMAVSQCNVAVWQSVSVAPGLGLMHSASESSLPIFRSQGGRGKKSGEERS